MFFSSAMAQAPGANPPGLIESFLIPMALMFVVFYFLLIRPQQQARKKHQAMIEGVKRGDTVITAGGLVAKVVRAPEGEEVIVELAEGVQATVVKSTLTGVRGRDVADKKK